MPRRYQAPEHTSAVFSPDGEHRADEKGVIELSDEASEAAHDALRRAGCVALEDAQGAQPAGKPAEAPSGAKSGPDGEAPAKAKAAD